MHMTYMKPAIATHLRRLADRLDAPTRGTLTITYAGSINDAKHSLERTRRLRAMGGASYR